MARFNYFSIDDDEVRFVLDQHAKLNLYYRASSLKQHSVARHVALLGLGHIILISLTPSLTLSKLILRIRLSK
jgi:hypothetical protein